MINNKDSRGVIMKMTKKFFAIMLTMALVFTSVPFVSMGAAVNLAAPEITYSNPVQDPIEKKNKKWVLNIKLDTTAKCTGYRLVKVNKKTQKETKVKDYTFKSVNKSKTIVFKHKTKSKVLNNNFVFKVKAYNKYYYNSKTKTWTLKKPAKKFWKGKKTRLVFSFVEQTPVQKEEDKDKDKEKEEETPVGGGGGGGGGGSGGGASFGGGGDSGGSSGGGNGKQDLPTFGGYDPNLETVPL